MTIDEALSKIQDGEVRTFLTNIISNQNKYVGELEKLAKTQTPQSQNQSALSKSTEAYLFRSMKRDTIEDAVKEILKDVPQDIYKAVEQDYLAFLDKNITQDNLSVQFCTDAFNLVYGKCLRNKEHAVNRVGKDTNPQVVTPITNTTNNSQVQNIQQVIANQPPVLNAKDQIAGSASGLPNTELHVKSTKDAFTALKNKFAGNGGKFM